MVVGVNSGNHSNEQVWQMTIHWDFAVFPWCSMNPHPQTLRFLSLSDEILGSALVNPIAKEEGKRNRSNMTWCPGSYAEQILRTYGRWVCGRKKQQSWSQTPANGCHCLYGCGCYWSSSSKSGNISRVVINIVRARKTIVLLYAGSPQVEL